MDESRREDRGASLAIILNQSFYIHGLVGPGLFSGGKAVGAWFLPSTQSSADFNLLESEFYN